MKKSGHMLVREVEDIDIKVDELSLILDLKVLFKNYYTATFTEDEKGLNIKFNNGQIFTITVKETK